MVPPIFQNPLETLEDLGGQIVQGAKQVPKKIIGQIPKSLETGFFGDRQNSVADKSQTDAQTGMTDEQKIAKMEAVSKQKSAQRYKEIQQQILAIVKKREQELPKTVTGQAGFSEDKMVKQLEVQKKPEKERIAISEKEREKQEPISIKREKRKSEMHRGASG